MPIREIGSVELWQSALLAERTEIMHGFTGRKGGVSRGPYASLSMSPRRGDDPALVAQNRAILCREAGFTEANLTSTNQEHTDRIELIDGESVGLGVARPWDKGVDAVVTLLPNVPLMAFAADCVPILLYAPDIGAVAAIHSGWRGTEARIAEKTAKTLISLGADAALMLAAIGPAIGRCCYEVGEEVALRFPESCRTDKGGGKYMLDLKLANELMLRGLGLVKIDNSAPCTKCENETFFSHRGQGGKSGTLAAVIERRELP